ncbi:MAG: hypothetical protein U0636_04470 [Phycisphaerales bacterium]
MTPRVAEFIGMLVGAGTTGVLVWYAHKRALRMRQNDQAIPVWAGTALLVAATLIIGLLLWWYIGGQ